MSWLLTKVVSAFLLPPLCFLLIGLAGLVFWSRRPRLARVLLFSCVSLLWLFSMPLTGRGLLQRLEAGQFLAPDARPAAQAIVLLGGGTCEDAPEYGGSTLCKATLERVRYAALLQRRTGLPLLVTGGDPEGLGTTEAAVLKSVLQEEFGVSVRWQEDASSDTRQNAGFSATLLKTDGVRTVLLVSHGWHLPRAKPLFEQAGLRVIPAGTGFHRDRRLDVLDFLPSSQGLEMSQIYFHEVIGAMRDHLVPAH